MLFGQVAALADLHRHAATRARITIPRNDYGAIMLSLFLVQYDAPSQPIRPQVSHSVRTALAADALALLLGLLLTAIYCRCVTSSCICQNLLCEDISTK